ncbi:Zinc finger, SWIM-type [Sesbania bispinosa]|nr:Zinc finger, SWIM-type [Sesbania bispinosa]
MLVTFNDWRTTVAFVGVSNFNESGTACQTQESFIHNDGQAIQGGCNDCHVPYEHMDENEDNGSASFHGEGSSNDSDEELENMNEDEVNSEDVSEDGEEEHTESTGPGSNDKDNEMNNSEGEGESSDEDRKHDSNDRNDIPIESEEEFGNIDFKSLTSSDLMKYHFPDREVSFDFYSWYARFHGFAARKERTVHNKKDEVIRQTFVCYREGGKIPDQRPLKRAPRKKTRCGCLASCQVPIWSTNNRWKMSEDDVVQMMNMRKVGIRTPHIYGSFSSQMGGYENVRFRKKDMYNEIDKLRRKKGSDATTALSYLQRLKRTHQALHWRHTSDEHGRLQHLFWTTSRVEGLHALLGKFVNSRNNLSEFLEHYQRCLSQMRFKEIEADFDSVHGEQQLQTQLSTLEKFAARVYTKEIFLMFRLVLLSATRVMVTSQKRSGSGFIYFVSKYRRPTKEWHVFFWPSTMELKCSCMRMESLGIPCDHLVAVIVYLDMTEIPKCLLLDRWTMCAKESIDQGQSVTWDPPQVCQT